MKTQKAFTIIELLVAVSIIALLTGIILTNLSTSKSRSRDAKRISDINQIQLALELYFDRCDQYPATLSLTANNGSCSTGINLGTFISKIPTAPNTGETYSYGVNSATNPTDYVLKTTLENNNQVLTDVNKTNYSSLTPAINCTTSYAYCIQPR